MQKIIRNGENGKELKILEGFFFVDFFQYSLYYPLYISRISRKTPSTAEVAKFEPSRAERWLSPFWNQDNQGYKIC